MNRPVMTSCCTFCIHMAGTLRALIRLALLKRLSALGGPSLRTIAAPALRRRLHPLHRHMLLQDLLSLFHDCPAPAWHRSRPANPASLRPPGHQSQPAALTTAALTHPAG